MINLTSAYAPFVNGGKKIEPNLITRIQDRRGKTIYQKQNRKCIGCDKFINDDIELPKIENNNEKVFSEETAYQMTSILQGAVKRGTAKKLRSLKVPLLEKQEPLMITMMHGSLVFHQTGNWSLRWLR